MLRRPLQLLHVMTLTPLVALCACTPLPRFTAEWYFVYATLPAAGEGNIVVALHNRGEMAQLNGIRTSTGVELLPQSYALRHDQLITFILPDDAPNRCLLPSRLQLRWSGRRRPTTVNVTGIMPTSLPRSWVERCGTPRPSDPAVQ